MCKACTRTSKQFKWEMDRIHQFEKKARDDDHFRQMILNRAAKCGPEKRERFIQTLKEMDRQDLAAFISLCLKQRGEGNE